MEHRDDNNDNNIMSVYYISVVVLVVPTLHARQVARETPSTRKCNTVLMAVQLEALLLI